MAKSHLARFDRLRDGVNVWAPFYTYHKIMAGHLDMYMRAGNEQALRATESVDAEGQPFRRTRVVGWNAGPGELTTSLAEMQTPWRTILFDNDS